MIALPAYVTDYGIGECLPATSLMRCRLSGPDRKNRIEQEDALVCPTCKVTAFRTRSAQITLYLLENVFQRRGEWDSRLNRKAQSMRLTRFMIRILTQYDCLDFIKRTKVKGIEYLTTGRIHYPGGIFRTYEFYQIGKIRFVKFTLKDLFQAESILTSIPSFPVSDELYAGSPAFLTLFLRPYAGLNLSDMGLLQQKHAKARLANTATY